MPQLLSASAPAKRWSGTSPGSATPTRSGSCSSPLLDLQDVGDGRDGAELVADPDRDPRRARLLRLAAQSTGRRVEANSGGEPAVEDSPLRRRDSTLREQPPAICNADLRGLQRPLDQRELPRH